MESKLSNFINVLPLSFYQFSPTLINIDQFLSTFTTIYQLASTTIHFDQLFCIYSYPQLSFRIHSHHLLSNHDHLLSNHYPPLSTLLTSHQLLSTLINCLHNGQGYFRSVRAPSYQDYLWIVVGYNIDKIYRTQMSLTKP